MHTIVNGLLLADGKVLRARRSLQRKAYAGLWSFPGGHVEPGETVEQALVRELREEMGIVPIAYDALGAIPDPNASAIYHLYAVTRWEGVPAIQDEEHSELRWLAPSVAARLPDLALEEYRSLLERLTPVVR